MNGNGGVRDAARQVADRTTAIARLELELAALELKKKAAALGVGIGLVAGAAVFAFFMVAFLFATIAAALATFLPWWLALLIVTLALALLAVVCGLVARNRFAAATPPVPEQAIEEAKRTKEVLRH
ncbi:MAG TPA: phage holin family protein [Gaiellaceae bacterium]|nr:phage holin family protein [Gaiellaceae bacterium]